MEYKLEFKNGKLKKIKVFKNILEIYKEEKALGNSISKAKELAKELYLDFYHHNSGFKNLSKY